MARPDYLTVPNALTMLRLAAVPLFLLFLWKHQAHWALACFVGAALTDSLDGLLARLLHQQSRLGALLDPLADKVLVFSALSALVLAGHIPVWLWLVIFVRDLFLTGVAAAVRRNHVRTDVTPSRIGKYATFFLSLLVTLVLVEATLSPSALLHLYVRMLTLVSGLAVAVSALQYFSRFGRLLIPPKTSSAS